VIVVQRRIVSVLKTQYLLVKPVDTP